ncbi:MAG: prepilin-type N-terminal cleavage/methylation domain-containing protein [Acetatifactor sp.]|nr:prepilin-type N-terminal cleavage/methylation domain-containing protein [Acetatifactor sp.]
MKNRNKINNNGFSLVELIIVIAIMAVLIGVLAPQYMKYVERGRVSTDKDNVIALEDAIKVYYVDPYATKAFTSGTVITFAASGVTVTGDTNSAVVEAVKNAGLGTTLSDLPGLTNKNTFATAKITITITDGNISTSNDLPD